MATTKLGNTKSASRAINYAEKRAEEKSGLNCDVDYAKSAFKQTRALYGKEDGVQAHTIIQSFKPGEVTAEQCNQLGLELAEKVAPNHQVAVYTHIDKDHYHNHIVINSVDLETGKKYQSNKKQRDRVKQENDNICREHGLSVPERDTAKLRYTQAEKALIDKDKYSWKDELREQIEMAKAHTSNLESFSEHLARKGIECKVRGRNVSYKPLNANKWVRGKTLGQDYDKEVLEHEFEKRTKQQQREAALERTKPNRAKDEQQSEDWRDFARTTDILERDRKRREREQAERERKAELIEEENRRIREKAREERAAARTVSKKARGFDLEL
ncbi:relaxase/mobilization nuclease domain-containing protein [Klebsiella pneumoniae]|nr:relaxase/mobilization nuclease domain-containing protein [Klebsiella pneumoniae]MCP6645859.1 relaxase/mobilization nuclease domain-containing protein [Klebsiella pneumoniae]MCP6651714.1 relaxase/mobilization nuclease domain-containing protein [Klebsiella pneumoniae]